MYPLYSRFRLSPVFCVLLLSLLLIRSADASLSPDSPQTGTNPAATLPVESAWVDITLRSRFDGAHSDFANEIAPAYLDHDFNHLWLSKTGEATPAAKALTELVRVFAALAPATQSHIWLQPYRDFLQRQSEPMPLALPRYLLATDLAYSEIYARLRHDIATERFIRADQDNDHQEYRYGGVALDSFRTAPKPWARQITKELQQAAALSPDARDRFLQQQIRSLYPPGERGEPLLSALRYWQQQSAQPWPELPFGNALRPGQIDSVRVPVLIEQLRRLQLLTADYAPGLPGRYDRQLEQAVRQVQQMHGQSVDGVIGLNTRKVLNRSPAERVLQLAHNFRRLYHLPEKLGPRHMMINMASYNLKLVEKNREPMQMRVIVGAPDQRTPIMKQSLTSVILSPRWNIPQSIGMKSILPKARANPNYLKEREIQIVDGWSSPAREVPPEQIDLASIEDPEQFPYRFVQLPGQYNQLGYVKFRLSNNKAIYMHDTPAKHLFDRTDRAMSNGCVRLEDALPLVDRLLAHEPWGWNKEQVQKVLRSKEERFLKMQPYLPVYLMYWTVWQDEESGRLQWRDDIYSKDRLPEPEEARRIMLAAQKELNARNR